MIPSTTIAGTIHSVDVQDKFTAIRIAVTNRGRDGDETKIYQVKWFRERATKFATPGLVGRQIVVIASVSSREHEGKFYTDLLGSDYGFHGGVATPPPAPKPEPVEEEPTDLPF